ncbi:MAG: hypothetical protein C0619_10390 [Desulfuromonas sp.]|nr:MAG: hypothetical protein C0619_10390 [Desulfuromonas sp.]
MCIASNRLKLSLALLLAAVALLTGCCPGVAVQPRGPAEHGRIDYVSEISLPEAKSTFAYTQYRLLVAEGRWEEALTALERAVALDAGSRYLRMSLAKAYLHTKQQDRAIQILRDLLLQFPDFSDGHELLADLLLHYEKPSKAVTHYRQALATKEQSTPLRLKLGMALARSGELAEAISVVSAILQDQPESLSAMLSLSRYYREDRQFSQAVNVYRQILAMKPGQEQVLLELADLLQQLNRIDEALELYLDGLEQQPGSIAMRERLARLLVQEKRYPEALQQLQELNDRYPDRPEVLSRIGLLQLEMKRWAEAELMFRKILRQQPDHDRSRYYLGMALSGAGDIRGALEELAEVAEDSPVRLEAVTQRAYLYQLNDQAQHAIELLRKELDKGSSEPILFYYLASSYASQDQLEQAEQVLRESLELYPEDVTLRYQLGVVLEKLDRRDAAREEMARILELDPEHADALNYMAYLKAETGENLELALSEVKRALATKEAGYLLDTLGWVYYKLGRFEEGRQPLEKALRLRPDDTVILEHLGDLYRALSLWQLAGEVYRRILELDPLAEGIQEKLDSIPEEQRQ